MENLKGKWALITGGTRGLGYLAAMKMAEYGVNLIIHSRNAEKSKDVCDEAVKLGVEAYPVACDLGDEKSVEKMLADIDGLGVQVDIVLNNAGFQIAYRTDFLKTPYNDYLESFKVNTIAPMMICYHFLPDMIKRGYGRIVNTTSGIDKEPEQAGYSGSKAALDKVTADVGTKLEGTDVMINLVDPGWCRTDLGGEMAPNSPESAVPGIIVGAFLSDKRSGRIFRAQDFAGMTLEDAVAKAETL